MLKALIEGVAIGTVLGLASVNNKGFGSKEEESIVHDGIDGFDYNSLGDRKMYHSMEAADPNRSLAEMIILDLPLGDINILVVLYVYSFVRGHPHKLD